MKIRTTTNWLLSAFGISAIAVSLALLTTSVFAQCSATVRCGMTDVYLTCTCSGGGMCVSGTSSVQCVCDNEPPQAKKVCDQVDP